MEKLEKLYLKDINRNIEGVIDAGDNAHVQQELEEYVVTNELLEYYRKFFDAYNTSINGLTDHMGVWISGFFGSGKSHFLKILSYLLENKEVGGKKAVDYFEGKIKDQKLLADIKRAGSVPSDVILFNIESVASTNITDTKKQIIKVFEKEFNQKLGLSIVPEVADLERVLIKENKYEEFKQEFEKNSGKTWENSRNKLIFSRDAFIKTYTNVLDRTENEASHWLDDAKKEYDVDISSFADRVNEYVTSCGNDKHVIFLVDEIGQYAGNDDRALLGLETIVEDLGNKCHGKAWVCVTAQAAIDKYVDVHSDSFSKIKGRFDTNIPLSSVEIDKVIKKRILEKNEASIDALELLYENNESVIKNLFSWKNASTQDMYKDKLDFAETYPFVPYQFKTLQNVFTDIREGGFAGKHISSGERSLLSAFQESAKASSDEEVGYLVPFYVFFDTITEHLEGPIVRAFANAKDIQAQGNLEEMDLNILKVLFMLKNIKYSAIPLNVENIAILCASNINTDILKLKEQVRASLKRLEGQYLIQRNNDEYRFLTDDEQEINRDIKKVVIDNSKVEDFLRETIYSKILTDRKFMYRNNPFELSLYLDGIKISAKEYEIGIKVVTPYSDFDAVEIQRQSTNDYNDVYAVLDIPNDLDEEIVNALKIEQYIINNRNVNKTKEIDAIVRGKENEAREAKELITKSIIDALKEADILIAGDKKVIPTAEPRTRVNNALEMLVKDTYSKLDYIKYNFTTSEIKTLFEESKSQMQAFNTDFVNQKAYDEVLDYLEEQYAFHASINISSLIQHFEKSPYGWLESDILYLLTKLLKDEKINLIYLNEVLGVTEPETLNRILKRDSQDKVVIQKHKAPDPAVINDVKLVAKTAFDKILSQDETSMISSLKEGISSKLRELDKIVGNYNQYSNFEYPGYELVKETTDLLSKINKINDPGEFFSEVASKKEIIIDSVDKVANVIEFFDKKQKQAFDDARKAVSFYFDNKDYADDSQELQDAVKDITDILNMDEPYSDIPKLPNLRDKLIKILGEMYDVKSKPIIQLAKDTIEYIKNESDKNKDIDNSLGERFIKILNNSIEEMNTSNELKDIFAKQTYIGRLKEDFNAEMDKAIALKEADKKGEGDPKVVRKIVKADSLLNRSYEINSEEDINKYIDDLRSKLLIELKENKSLTIR